MSYTPGKDWPDPAERSPRSEWIAATIITVTIIVVLIVHALTGELLNT